MLRTARERLLQTAACETGWIVLAVPAYALLFDQPVVQSSLLVMALWLAGLAWSPVFNTVFDLAEWRLARRAASDRPTRLRLVHALAHEASSVVVTAPLIMIIGGHGLLEAIAIDIGLSILDATYTYLFHVAYDRLRPVAKACATGVSQARTAASAG